jgi:hypothetical protein
MLQTHYYSENLVAPRIEPGTSGSVAKNSDPRGDQNEKLSATKQYLKVQFLSPGNKFFMYVQQHI